MLREYKPTVEEMSFRQELLSDPATMSYNDAWGGTVDFPEENWKAYHENWVESDSNDYFYAYLKDDENDKLVGEIAYHYNKKMNMHLSNVIIRAKYRGRGYGKKALLLLCDIAKKNNIMTLYDNIALNNSAVKLFIECGFFEESRDETAIYLRKDL